MNKLKPTLTFCILMDALGYATYALPGIGEFGDIIWAPISAIIFYKSFGGWKGAFGGLFNFAEEILPGTDFIPTFTITWIWKYFTDKKTSAARSFNTAR
ncbi:MAG: hypothetical protein ABIN89_01165 [Chitinophagaceae bacterium]